MKSYFIKKEKSNLNWVFVLGNILCDISLKTDDIQILLRISSFLRFYISLCKESIELQ